MLSQVFKNVWASFLVLLTIFFIHGRWSKTIFLEAAFFENTTHWPVFLLLFIRALALTLVVTLWSEVFRQQLLSSGNRYTGLLYGMILLVVLNRFWIAQELLSLIIVTLMMRRVMSSTEVLNPSPPMFEAGLLVALASLIDVHYLLLLIPLILANLFLGRVGLRIQLVPLFGIASSVWILWALADLSGQKPGKLNDMGDWLASPSSPMVMEGFVFSFWQLVLIPAVWIAYTGFRSEWSQSRAVERQILQLLFWEMILFFFLGLLPFAGGSFWWSISALPFSLLAAKSLGGVRRPWLRELWVLALLCIPVLHLLWIGLSD